METRHVRLGYEEALSAKKQMLLLELNFLQIAKKIRNYKLLRKKEILEKSILKKQLKELKTGINSLNSTFPEKEEPMKTKAIKGGIEKRNQQDIKNQLEEIQKKLSALQ